MRCAQAALALDPRPRVQRRRRVPPSRAFLRCRACRRPRSSSPDERLEDLASPATDAADPVRPDGRRDDDRLRVRERVRRARRLDLDRLAVDEVQHVEAPARLVRDLLIEVQPVDAVEQIVALTERVLDAPPPAADASRLGNEVAPNGRTPTTRI